MWLYDYRTSIPPPNEATCQLSMQRIRLAPVQNTKSSIMTPHSKSTRDGRVEAISRQYATSDKAEKAIVLETCMYLDTTPGPRGNYNVTQRMLASPSICTQFSEPHQSALTTRCPRFPPSFYTLSTNTSVSYTHLTLPTIRLV